MRAFNNSEHSHLRRAVGVLHNAVSREDASVEVREMYPCDKCIDMGSSFYMYAIMDSVFCQIRSTNNNMRDKLVLVQG